MAIRAVRESIDEARPGGDGAGGGAEQELAEVGLGGGPGGGGVEERWVEGEFRGHFFELLLLYAGGYMYFDLFA